MLSKGKKVDHVAMLFDSYFSKLKITGKYQALYKKLAGERFIDLLLHIPNAFEERTFYPFLSQTTHNEIVTLRMRVVSHHPNSYQAKRPYRITCTDGVHTLDLIFFRAQQRYLEKIAPIDQEICISGKINQTPTGKQIHHPDHIGNIDTLKQWSGVFPIYPLTAGISQRVLRAHIQKALQLMHLQQEWYSPKTLENHKMISFFDALKVLHNPNHSEEYAAQREAALLRLAYDEIFSQQLALQLSRKTITPKLITVKNQATFSDNMNVLLSKLPFTLTQCQTKALKEVIHDFNTKSPSLRLIQGDVGSGKTIVALLSALFIHDQGGQIALLAPTEILARQHFNNISKLVDEMNINVRLLISKSAQKVRNQVYSDTQSGITNILIGTHALIQDKLAFENLKLVIIDEQHRFGVEQRLKLTNKGNNPHILSMTATPIPRTLTLAQYGDMDVSLIREKPPGRKPIVTKVISLHKFDDVITNLMKRLDQGDKVYWVCPLIDESEKSDLAAATERFKYIQASFEKHACNVNVDMLHGKMSADEKQHIMDKFITGETSVLVSTTVIEVGVDVKDANIMIIEHAERFGLSQLHQLRGRVGRGEKASICLLLFGEKLSFTARKRLEAMRETEDGFKLAEIDLRLRGSGEITGTKQSGLPNLKFADLQTDDNNLYQTFSSFLEEANFETKKIAFYDPDLKTDENARLNTLLQIFNKDRAAEFQKSG